MTEARAIDVDNCAIISANFVIEQGVSVIVFGSNCDVIRRLLGNVVVNLHSDESFLVLQEVIKVTVDEVQGRHLLLTLHC